MIYDEAFFEIEDQIDSLVTAIKASETCRNYQIAKQTMHQDPVAQELMRTFLEKKLDFERIEAYGAYAPVKVDAGSPFFQSKSSCGGNCHARG